MFARIVGMLMLSSVLWAQPPRQSTIQFEDATAASGINFTHSFGSQKLGSLLEGTGARLRLVRLQQRRLSRPLRCHRQAARSGHASVSAEEAARRLRRTTIFIKNNGNGNFTDVTDQAGVAANIYGMAAIAADFDNDGFVDLFVPATAQAILYHNNGNGTFTDVTAKAGINVDGWSISSAWLDYDRDGCVDLFVGRYVKFDPKYRDYYRRRQLSRPARLRRRHQPSVSQQLQRNVHRCDR